jgi:hypothetical protein
MLGVIMGFKNSRYRANSFIPKPKSLFARYALHYDKF